MLEHLEDIGIPKLLIPFTDYVCSYVFILIVNSLCVYVFLIFMYLIFKIVCVHTNKKIGTF